ncbi:hypothetical protein HDU82_006132 [Entophlyctis luteolus]|nr:hypothetical protein HDU82_006132 [Entophlyctis luteolus]
MKKQHAERVRIMSQAAAALGLPRAAALLLEESGVGETEPPQSLQLRAAVLAGDWSAARAALAALFDASTAASSASAQPCRCNPRCSSRGSACTSRLRVALNAISLQSYLELLEASRTSEALVVLRKDIAPAYTSSMADHNYLHELSSLMMCLSQEDLHRKACWDGANGKSRSLLLAKIQKTLALETMMPENRLDALLDQALRYQAHQCLYHNIRNDEISLVHDHECDRSLFPTETVHVLELHTDEVWFVAFSPDSKYLASASKDMSVIIWDTEQNFRAVQVLHGHTAHISVVAWSPDSTCVISGSNDWSIKLWNVTTGACISTYSLHEDSITALAFLPPTAASLLGTPAACVGQATSATHFVSASLDKNVFLWRIEDGRVEHRWNGVRVIDFGVHGNRSTDANECNSGADGEFLGIGTHALKEKGGERRPSSAQDLGQIEDREIDAGEIRLVTISDRRIRVYDVVSKDEIK